MIRQLAKYAPSLPNSFAQAPIGLGITVFLFGAVVLAPQTPEMLAGMQARFDSRGFSSDWIDKLAGPAGLGIASILLALTAWYWSRAAIMANHQHPDGSIENRRNIPGNDLQYPRYAYVAALAICLIPFLETVGTSLDWHIKVIGAASFLLGLYGFRVLFKRTGWGWVGRKPIPSWMWRSHITALFAAAPFGPIVALSLVAFNVIVVVVAASDWGQAAIERSLHTPSAAIGALAFSIAPLTIALELLRDIGTFVVRVYIEKRPVTPIDTLFPRASDRRRFGSMLGMLSFLGLLLFAGSLTTASTYQIRTVSGDGSDPRPTLKDAVRDWVSLRMVDTTPRPIPVIIVAAEGGASRASVHLLSMMRFLDRETSGSFSDYLFAISSVSGGSHGAVSYALLQQNYPMEGRVSGVDWNAEAPANRSCLNTIEFAEQLPQPGRALTELARADMLSASIATFFSTDTIRPFFGRVMGDLPDRGVRLANAFERHWTWCRSFAISEERAKQGLVALGGSLGSQGPHLLITGTDAELGSRLITSTIQFRVEEGTFKGAEDFLAISLPRVPQAEAPTYVDVPVSGAVMNSARFPIVSPAGRFTDKHKDRRQIVDGGYFENYGARTALELSEAIEAIGAADKSLPPLVPIIVVVSNDGLGVAADDPRLHDGDTEADSRPPRLSEVTIDCRWATKNRMILDQLRGQAELENEFSTEWFAPAQAVYAIRAAHGFVALREIQETMCPPATNRPRMFHLAVPKPLTPRENGKQAAPLNWVLSDRTRRFLLEDVPAVDFNMEAASSVKAVIEDLLK